MDEVEAERSTREEKRKNKKSELRAFKKAKLARFDRDAERLSSRYRDKTFGRHSEDSTRDGLRLMGQNLTMELADNTSHKMQTKLINSLEAAMSHKDHLRHRAKTLGDEYQNSIEADDIEMARERRLEQHSIQEELIAISDYISDLQANLVYLRE